MKKTATIFLLLLLGINSIGLYPVLKLIEYQAKESAADAILKGIGPDLVVFANLNDHKDIKWEEENKEFCYNGGRYDVVKVEQEEGNTLFYCYNDKKEARIAADIDNIIYKQMTGNKDVSQNVMLHLMMMMAQVFMPAEPFSLKNLHTNEHIQFAHRCVTSHYPGCCIEIPIPPPWA